MITRMIPRCGEHFAFARERKLILREVRGFLEVVPSTFATGVERRGIEHVQQAFRVSRSASS